MNKRVLVILLLIIICISLFVYCYLCGKEEKYKEIIKFSTQSGPVKDNYYVLTDPDNDDIIRGNRYPLNKRQKYLNHLRNNKRRERETIMPQLTTDGIKVKPYGFYSEVPDINEYIHSYDYQSGHKVLNGFDIYNTKALNDIDLNDLNVINVNDFYRPYDFHYKPVVNSSTYPIRDSQVELKNGMITSSYPNICSMYGSSNLPDNINGYFPSTWCNIGILTNDKATPPFNSLGLYAQYTAGSIPWRYRVSNPLGGNYIFLSESTKGSGTYWALRDGDQVSNIPGFPGTYICQIQKDRMYIFESN